MMVNGVKIKGMAKVDMLMLVDVSTKVNGILEIGKAKVSKLLQKEVVTRDYGI